MNNVIAQLIPAEQKKIFAKWKGTGLLKGADDWEALQLSSILENQHLLNQMMSNITKWSPTVHQLFKRISIPIIRRVFDPISFVPYQMVSIQCMAGPKGMAYYLDRYGVFKHTQVIANTRLMRTKMPLFVHNYKEPEEDTDIKPWWPDESENLFLTQTYPELFENRSQTMLDNETELIISVGVAMQQEIIREIITDLRNITELHLTHTWKSPQKLADFIRVASSELGREVGGEANWLVVSKEIGEELSTLPDFVACEIPVTTRPDLDCHKIGDLNNKWTIISNPDAQPSEILFGKRATDNPLDSGYFYCPYCPITFQPAMTKKTDTVIISRYSKKAVNTKYYAVINLIGYVPIPKEDIPQEIKLPEGTGRTIVLDVDEAVSDVELDMGQEAKEVSKADLTLEELELLEKTTIGELSKEEQEVLKGRKVKMWDN